MLDKSIDVVIPVHNRAKELDRALSSLFAQHDRNFRVIVCDDGSSDDLSSVIGQWKSALCIDFVRMSPSGGPARPRNIGVQRSNAAWISFLDSDDWWFPHKVGSIRAALSDGVDVVYHPLRIERGLDRAALGFRRRAVVGAPVLGPDVIMHMLRRGNPVATSGATVRRDALLSVGGFNENLNRRGIEDFDCWLHLAARVHLGLADSADDLDLAADARGLAGRAAAAGLGSVVLVARARHGRLDRVALAHGGRGRNSV